MKNLNWINNSERIDDLGINNLKIIQNKDYFCFGTDSALLANFVNSLSNKNIILDLCSGSGVIPFIISAKKNYSKIIGVELQDQMFDLFVRNISLNNLQEKIICLKDNVKNISGIREKIYKITNRDNVDIIVCNPPYKRNGTGIINKNDVKIIARHEIMCNLEDIFITSSKLLRSKGKLYLVHKPERIVDLISIARKYKLEAKNIRFIHPKYNLKPSIVLIEYVRDGGNECKILDPLIEYNQDGTYTNEIYEIYGMQNKK